MLRNPLSINAKSADMSRAIFIDPYPRHRSSSRLSKHKPIGFFKIIAVDADLLGLAVKHDFSF